MNKKIIEKFKELFPLGILKEPLKKYCTFRIGGPADLFYKAKTSRELINLIKFTKDFNVPYIILGAGCNILFDDKGFRGLVIKLEMKDIGVSGEKITAGAGVLISALLNESLKHNLSGLESWVALPGTVGGAVRGNAGCSGLETKDILEEALILDPKTLKTQKVKSSYFKFGYRTSSLKKSDKILLSATFKLNKNKFSKIQQAKKMETARQFRIKKQPFNPSAGSFFKNPSPASPAGMLIDKAGLKGKTIGRAQISEKHANFLVNLGGATAKNIRDLAKLAKKEVKRKFKINLTEEVQILSDKPMTKP